MNEIAVI